MGRADDLDRDDLRYFPRAAQARTLAGAARAMGVERATIARRLSALERSLGAPLVLRGPEGLRRAVVSFVIDTIRGQGALIGGVRGGR